MLNCFPAGVYWGGIITLGIEQATEGRLQRLRFPAASGSSAITLPFDGFFCASISRVTINPCNPEQSASCCSGKKGEYNIGSWFTWTRSSCLFRELETSVGGKGEGDRNVPCCLSEFLAKEYDCSHPECHQQSRGLAPLNSDLPGLASVPPNFPSVHL